MIDMGVGRGAGGGVFFANAANAFHRSAMAPQLVGQDTPRPFKAFIEFVRNFNAALG